MVSVYDLLILSQIPNIGAHRLRALISYFGTSEKVFTASAREIAGIEGFSRRLASTIMHFLRHGDLGRAKCYATNQLSRVNSRNLQIVTFWDSSYPEVLRRIYDPPPFLFVHGTMADADIHSVAIVGTRSPSDYGIALAEKFSSGLARLGMTVVSGLARGVDTVVHTAALNHAGRTLAVIGSGLDVIYPSENKALSEKISARGAVISEYDMGAKPDAMNFPRRNRIISGLSLGTLIIETDVNGGAMITASTALDQNREVFAVPGNVNTKRSRGCNALIKEGKAKLVDSIEDVLVELAAKLPRSMTSGIKEDRIAPADLTLFERVIFDHLSASPIHIDALAERLRTATADVLVNLLSLEFKGLIKQLPGKLFMRL